MINSKTIIAQAPVRISFSGGGTDFPQYFKKFGGCVLSTTINKYITVIIEKNHRLKDGILIDLADYHVQKIVHPGESFLRDADPFTIVQAVLKRFNNLSGLTIHISSGIPSESGLGTSSAVTVALLGGLVLYMGKTVSKRILAKKAIIWERKVAQRAGGWQDQYASSFGGFNLIEFAASGKVSVTQLKIPVGIRKELEKGLLLFHIKRVRSSQEQQKYIRGKMNTDRKTIEALHNLRKIAVDMKDTLLSGDLQTFAQLLHQSWEGKKNTSSLISNEKIDSLYQKALQNGAFGGKLLGAGGGGCFLLYCPVSKQNKLKEALGKFEGNFIDFHFENKGFHIL